LKKYYEKFPQNKREIPTGVDGSSEFLQRQAISEHIRNIEISAAKFKQEFGRETAGLKYISTRKEITEINPEPQIFEKTFRTVFNETGRLTVFDGTQNKIDIHDGVNIHALHAFKCQMSETVKELDSRLTKISMKPAEQNEEQPQQQVQQNPVQAVIINTTSRDGLALAGHSTVQTLQQTN
jgi:hypothetical protein